MRIDDYTNRLTRPDLLVRYSRTLEALHVGAYSKFDAVFAGAAERAERISAGYQAERPDTVIAEVAREYSREFATSGRDTLIAETAQRYAKAVNTSGRDAVLAASRYEQLARTYDSKRRDITCV